MIFRQSTRDYASAVFGVLALIALAFGHRTQEELQSAAANHSSDRLGVVRIAYMPNITHAVALVATAKHAFEKELPGYGIEPHVVNAGPEAMEALLAGAIDFAYVGPSPAINTYLKSKGQALRIIAGACSGGASLIARSDANIHRIADLNGRRVAVPQIGGTQDVSLRHFLGVEGLASKENGGTVEILPIANPDILALFKSGELDAAWVPEPWASRLRIDAGGVAVVDERDLWPNRRFTTTVLVVRKDYADAHPDVVSAVLKAHLDTLKWVNSHPAESQKVANSELKRLTGKALRESIIREAWTRVSFDADPNLASLEAFAAAARAAGYAKPSSIPLDQIVQTPLVATRAGRP